MPTRDRPFSSFADWRRRLRNFLRGRADDGQPWRVGSIIAWLFAGALTAIIAIFGLLAVDWRAIPGQLAGVNAAVVVLLMVILPLGGFSIGLIYLIAGVRFGPLWGGVVVTGITAAHLMLSHWIARGVLRRPLERWMTRRQFTLPHVPRGEEIGFSFLGALVPGIPYFLRNYLIALSGLPFRTYFSVFLPVYVARSYMVIFLGDYTHDPEHHRLVIIGAFYLVSLSVCGVVLWRLRKRYQIKTSTVGTKG